MKKAMLCLLPCVVIFNNGFFSAIAQPTLSPATFYELRGGGIEIKYFATGITGEPSLSYKDANQAVTFNGDKIRTLHTELGDLVSVTLMRGREGGDTIFSLIIPRVDLAGERAPVRTHGITTKNKIGVPRVAGQQTKNTITLLMGSGSLLQP